jgi:hypothetical protein
MPDFYFILFLKRLDADEKLQYFQLPYIPCRMVSGSNHLLFYYVYMPLRGPFNLDQYNLVSCIEFSFTVWPSWILNRSKK